MTIEFWLRKQPPEGGGLTTPSSIRRITVGYDEIYRSFIPMNEAGDAYEGEAIAMASAPVGYHGVKIPTRLSVAALESALDARFPDWRNPDSDWWEVNRRGYYHDITFRGTVEDGGVASLSIYEPD